MEIARSLPGSLEPHLAPLLAQVQYVITDKTSSANVKVPSWLLLAFERVKAHSTRA
jgi:hypothetical protein